MREEASLVKRGIEARRIELLFHLLPGAVLGAVLFLTGAQLALGSCDFSKNKAERLITLTMAACAIRNVGLALVVGIIGWALPKRGWLRL